MAKGKEELVQTTVYLRASVDEKVEEHMVAFNQTKSGAIEFILMQAFGMAPEVADIVQALRERSKGG